MKTPNIKKVMTPVKHKTQTATVNTTKKSNDNVRPTTETRITENEKSKISINMTHEKLRHLNKETTRKCDAHLGMELTRGSLSPCLACAAAKAKQKNYLQSKHQKVYKQKNPRDHSEE